MLFDCQRVLTGLWVSCFLRLTVRRVLEALTTYPNWDHLITEYPGLEREDIRQALEWAAHYLDDEIIALDAA